MKELLTHSRQDCFKTCRKKHWFAYELGLRRIDDARALRMGSAFHAGIDALGAGLGIEQACIRVRDSYWAKPEYIDQQEWDYETETILRLICGYEWRWENDKLEYIATEFSFRLPLVNPETKGKSKTFDLAGKIDGIVKLADGRKAVKESKTLGEDLGTDAPLWRRLRIDHQISLYVLAARRMGYDVDCVLYDVTRKPTIKPTQVPILDNLGVKIVLDGNGERVKTKNGWRLTADPEKGYVLQQRPMTPAEWGEKLTNDIAERPEYYYRRVEVPRLDKDLAEFEVELWDISRTIADAQNLDRHYRTVNRETCAFCSYFDPCTTGYSPSDNVPEGFVKLSNIHPELGLPNDSNSSPPGSQAQSAASTDCPF